MATTTTVYALRRNLLGTVPHIAASAYGPGTIVQIADGRIGVFEGLSSPSTNDLVDLAVAGQFDVVKNATSDTYSVGAPVYWDPTNNVAKTTSAGGYYYVGRCVIASVSGDTYVYTDLNAVAPKRYPTATVAAAGSAQGDAAALIEGFNIVTGANGTVGVILPTAVAGMEVIIKGTTSGVLKVYPAGSGIINALSASAAISLASGVIPAIFVASSATQWYTIPLVPS